MAFGTAEFDSLVRYVKDQVLHDKWNLRHEEWTRLAALAHDDHIADVCRKMAEQAETMRRFWS